MAWAGHSAQGGHEAGALLPVRVQFEAELTKRGSETEILVFEQTQVLVKTQTPLQNSNNYKLPGREAGV